MDKIIESLADYLAVFVSLLALIISLQSYRRERRKSNQDLLFQEKIKAYQEILFQANFAISQLFDLLNEVQNFELPKEEWEAKYQIICGNYYGIAEDFRGLLFRYIAVLPNKVFSNLDILAHKFTGFVTSATHCNSTISVESYDRIELQFNKVVDLLRKDLHVDKLNNGLSLRIR